MFGPDLLVAPVLYEGALARGVSACGDRLEGCLDRRGLPGRLDHHCRCPAEAFATLSESGKGIAD